MKNSIKKIMFIACLAVTLIGKANTNNDLDYAIEVLNDLKVKVTYNHVKKGQLLSIKDQDGTLVYSEKVSENGRLVKVLDLSNLENGNYNIELEKDFRILVNPIKVENNKLVFDETLDKVVFKPVVRNKEDLLLISKLTFDNNPLQLSIYYEDELIYSESIKEKATIIKRAYRLEKEIEGTYKVVLNSNNRSYTHNFSI